MENEEIKKIGDGITEKFFFQWSILSGATLTLLLPFVQSLKKDNGIILSKGVLDWAIMLLSVSLIISLIRNFVTGRLYSIGSKSYDPSKYKIYNLDKVFRIITSLRSFRYLIEGLPILAYVVALFLLYLFVKTNLGI